MSGRLPKLYLVRHAIRWTDSRRKIGRTDLPLELRQTRLSAFAKSCSSSVRRFLPASLRASRTCIDRSGEVAEVSSDLLEWDYGRLEGKPLLTFRRTRLNVVSKVVRGESPVDVARRRPLISRVFTCDGDVLAFSSGHHPHDRGTLAGRRATDGFCRPASVGVLILNTVTRMNPSSDGGTVHK